MATQVLRAIAGRLLVAFTRQPGRAIGFQPIRRARSLLSLDSLLAPLADFWYPDNWISTLWQQVLLLGRAAADSRRRPGRVDMPADLPGSDLTESPA